MKIMLQTRRLDQTVNGCTFMCNNFILADHCYTLNFTVHKVVLRSIWGLHRKSNRIPVQVDSSNNDSNYYYSQTCSNDPTNQFHCNRIDNLTVRSTLQCDSNVTRPHYKIYVTSL